MGERGDEPPGKIRTMSSEACVWFGCGKHEHLLFVVVIKYNVVLML